MNFLKLLPNELIFSFIGRYHEISPNKSNTQSVLDLFGNRKDNIFRELPSSISFFSKKINLDEMEIVNYHTLFRFYAPFMESFQANKILEDMLKCTVKNTRYTGGIYQNPFPVYRHLKYCTRCFQEGKHYWNRDHQVVGIRVCSLHNELLIASSFIVPDEIFPYQGKNLNDDVVMIKSCPQDKMPTFFDIYYAENVNKLLNHDFPLIGLKEINRRYKELLKIKGYADGNNRISMKKLVSDFLDFFGKEKLSDYYSDIHLNKRGNWIENFFYLPNTFRHPIRHLLLLFFLGIDIETFLTSDDLLFLPFGEGPWICFNPVCSKYKTASIKRCEITGKKNKLRGRFRCDCDFEYNRSISGSSEEFTVIKYGLLWEERLIQLLQDRSISIKKIAKELHVTQLTVIRKRDRLIYQNYFSYKSQTDMQRTKWLKVLKENKDMTITSIRKIHNGLYLWLFRNDKKWLNENLPIKYRKKISHYKKDWIMMDQELSEKIESAVHQLTVNQIKLRRITINMIAKSLNCKSILPKYIDKLPQTKMKIQNHLESEENFIKRKIDIISKRLATRGLKLTKSRLINWCNLSGKCSNEALQYIGELLKK